MASLPNISTASRAEYFRSSDTAKACLCELSSRVSSRLAPSSGQMLSRCSRADMAFKVAGTRRLSISGRSKRRKRLSFHLLRSRRITEEMPSRMIQRGGSANVKICLVMISVSVRSGRIFSASAFPYCALMKLLSSGSVFSVTGLTVSIIQRSGTPLVLRISPAIGINAPESSSFMSGAYSYPKTVSSSGRNSR
ncbi:MAG: hypothetical protein BWY07_02755 [Candidatus Hydrogenedentes bacterium ADurb.Bin170]|nr:MAG: hypothetical protein BWY07_02755 [Candidatus Hydrogenedentes bacterium ADurb.Bin170]